MRFPSYTLLLLLFIALLTGCGGSEQPASEAEAAPAKDTTQQAEPHAQQAPGQVAPATGSVKQRGKAYAQQAASALFAALQQSINERGVAASIGFCSERAYPITDSVARANGAQIQRVSHKPRNPQNAASIQEMVIIDKFREATEAEEQPQPVVQQRGDKAVFYAPIVIPASLCLNCHGQPKEDIAPETLQAIQQAYPQDQATGFAVGDLRGMWKITLPKKQMSMR